MTKEEILEKHAGDIITVYGLSSHKFLRAMEEHTQQQTSELREMLERCDKTFGIIDKIITSLKACDTFELPGLMDQIDIDLPLAQAQIKDLLNKKV